jgi:hypothetical protein
MASSSSVNIERRMRYRRAYQIVAIKKFKEPDTNEAIRKTSIREVKILRMLNHPNIVKLSEAFRRKDRLCLVFEFVDFSLLELIEKHPGGLDVSFGLTPEGNRSLPYLSNTQGNSLFTLFEHRPQRYQAREPSGHERRRYQAMRLRFRSNSRNRRLSNDFLRCHKMVQIA